MTTVADDGTGGDEGTGAAHVRGDWGGDPVPAPTASYGPLRSPRRRRRAAGIAVGTASVLSGLEALADGWAFFETRSTIGDEPAGGATPLGALTVEQDVVDRLNAATGLASILALVAFLGLLASAIFVIRWQNVVVGNQRGLGIERPRYSPVAAGFSWFVPIWSLFGPKRAINDAWRAAAPTGDAPIWLRRTVPGLFTAWWATWIVGLVSGGLAGRADGGDLDGDAVVFGVSTVAAVLTVVAGVLFVLVMEQLTSRHEQRIAERAS